MVKWWLRSAVATAGFFTKLRPCALLVALGFFWKLALEVDLFVVSTFQWLRRIEIVDTG